MLLLALIRREFWEHRALWLWPVSIGVALLLATAMFGRLPLGVFSGPVRGVTLFQINLLAWATPFYIAAMLLATFYLIDCLYGERRDRSILFWRSLPVSDTLTVLAKLLVGLLIVPLGTYVLVGLVSVVASAILVARNHLLIVADGVPLWDMQAWLRMQGVMFYGLIAALLWYAPYGAYLMLASVWARRSPSLWAFIPPVLLAMAENLLFGTHYVGDLVERAFSTLLGMVFRLNQQIAITIGDTIVPIPLRGGTPRHPPPRPDLLALLGNMLTNPQLWLGLVAAAAMIVLTIRLRRYRDDS